MKMGPRCQETGPELEDDTYDYIITDFLDFLLLVILINYKLS